MSTGKIVDDIIHQINTQCGKKTPEVKKVLFLRLEMELNRMRGVIPDSEPVTEKEKSDDNMANN